MIWIIPLMIAGTVILAIEVIVLIFVVMGATFGSVTRTERWYKRRDKGEGKNDTR